MSRHSGPPEQQQLQINRDTDQAYKDFARFVREQQSGDDLTRARASHLNPDSNSYVGFIHKAIVGVSVLSSAVAAS